MALIQKNIRIEEKHQKMIDKMLDVHNERLSRAGYPEMKEAEFCRFLIQNVYEMMLSKGEVEKID